MNQHYAAVIADLTAQRKPHVRDIEVATAKLAELDALIANIREAAMLAAGAVSQEVGPGTYTDMSMRWAILYMLAEHTSKTLTTSEICTRMRAGGFVDRPNFNSKVSAIVSSMVSAQELERTDMGYAISTLGLEKWKNIKAGEKFLTRHNHGTVEMD